MMQFEPIFIASFSTFDNLKAFFCLALTQPSTGISDVDFVSYVHKWREAGASLIGGCCRTTPNTIKAISAALKKENPKASESKLRMMK